MKDQADALKKRGIKAGFINFRKPAKEQQKRLGEVRKQLGSPLTAAFTATAAPDVQQDIIRSLGFGADEMKTFHQGIRRPDLRLEASECFSDDEKIEQIINFADETAGSGIVYSALIKTSERFSEMLDSEEVPHLLYRGKLPQKQRKRIQDAFMSSDVMVLATNAFGMG